MIKRDYRWHEYDKHYKPVRTLTYKETLEAMCKEYGTFCGRWHSNEFWKRTLEQIPNMTEEECDIKVHQIESEADADLAYWQAYQ